MQPQFVNGKAEIRKGRKIIASIIHREVFYNAHHIKSSYSPEYPFSIEIKNVGSRECANIEECLLFIEKYS